MTKRTCSVDGCDRPGVQAGMCWAHYERKRKGRRLDGKVKCKTCGEFFPRKSSGPDPSYCSRACRNPNPKRINGPSICLICERPTASGRYCTNTCRGIDVRFKGKRPKSKPCTICGALINFTDRDDKGWLRPTNTKRCESCRVRRRRYPLDIHGLVARDGDACSVCGETVNLSLPFPDPLSPSVDHVHPLALGGSEGPENLALAHLICNVRKGISC